MKILTETLVLQTFCIGALAIDSADCDVAPQLSFLPPSSTMRAYYFDNLPGDQRLPHDSNEIVSEETLKSAGVLYWPIPVEHWETQINEVAKERDYKNRDTISVTKEGLGEAYESKIKMFYEECVSTLLLACSVTDQTIFLDICMKTRRSDISLMGLVSLMSEV